MANTALDALAGENILESNSLGAVMRHCVVLKSLVLKGPVLQGGDNNPSETVISLAVISSVKRINTSYPGLLVIACSAFLIAAAAASSKQGGGAAGPIALFGLLFVIAYWLTRRASVTITAGSEVTETVQGSPSEASAFMTALQLALEQSRRAAA
jgi:hypothetical protein